jgi:GT2 family glycosyltransferase
MATQLSAPPQQATRETIAVAPEPNVINARPQVEGKFLVAGGRKLYVRGVTYGTFRPDARGSEYHDPATVERDFAQMAQNNINALRTYTVPPRWLLDIAQQHGLYVMVGLPWEQHVAFLQERSRRRSIEERVREGVRQVAGHPALLCYAIGNEIPAPIVRWQGRRPVERFIKRLYSIAKEEDRAGLVTYVNYPTTEYLHLPFLDFLSFNVYLESLPRLEKYLARLQNIAGDRPLLMAEVGLDSQRNGEETQARSVAAQVQGAFASGCAGAFVFSWTDEWHRGGHDVEDWDFGLTTRDRQPKPALAAIREVYSEVPFPASTKWPRVSVAVCTYNGSRTIRETLEATSRLEYPDYEVIVVDDGSTDSTPAIAAEYDVRVIHTENRGLSSARNTAYQAATGEIIAYLDDDAYPDPHWLTYLAATFMRTGHAGVGGPNIPPPSDGPIADCVANSPGGPTHVLLSDRKAEHIPGCNMAFRRECLQEVGGFDPQFRIAGDDVDLCWRLHERGWTLGFSPAAVVWHHRRNSVRAYLRQQRNYGKAEALLERKWPEKYNSLGHLVWHGRLYSKGLSQMLSWGQGRIYQGTWGSALFQSIYQPGPGILWSISLMPEWYLLILVLAALSCLSIFWSPLLFALPLLIISASAPLVQAIMGSRHASFHTPARSLPSRFGLRTLTAFLHVSQPVARLLGRLSYGLHPWRWRGGRRLALPWLRQTSVWSEQWQDPAARLEAIESTLLSKGIVVRRGGEYDHWDLEVRGGLLAGVRLIMGMEEHGSGKQMARFRLWPSMRYASLALILFFIILPVGNFFEREVTTSLVLAAISLLFLLRMFFECAVAMGATLHTIKGEEEPTARPIRKLLGQARLTTRIKEEG